MMIINFTNAQINIPSPSDYIRDFLSNPGGNSLTIFFQGLYSLLFALFIALAFIYFLYGALQYLVSGAGIFSKEEGKNKMKNAIIAVIIVLIVPVIVNFINPDVYKGLKFYIPVVQILSSGAGGGEGTSFSRHGTVDYQGSSENFVLVNIKGLKLNNIYADEHVGDVFVDPSIFYTLLVWDSRLDNRNTKIRVTSGFRPDGARCHKEGKCLDFVPESKDQEREDHQNFCQTLIDVFETTYGLREGNNYDYRTTIETKTPTKCENPNCCMLNERIYCNLDEKVGVGDYYWTCPGTTGYHIHMTFKPVEKANIEELP